MLLRVLPGLILCLGNIDETQLGDEEVGGITPALLERLYVPRRRVRPNGRHEVASQAGNPTRGLLGPCPDPEWWMRLLHRLGCEGQVFDLRELSCKCHSLLGPQPAD